MLHDFMYDQCYICETMTCHGMDQVVCHLSMYVLADRVISVLTKALSLFCRPRTVNEWMNNEYSPNYSKCSISNRPIWFKISSRHSSRCCCLIIRLCCTQDGIMRCSPACKSRHLSDARSAHCHSRSVPVRLSMEATSEGPLAGRPLSPQPRSTESSGALLDPSIKS